jgi:hypothetical protein
MDGGQGGGGHHQGQPGGGQRRGRGGQPGQGQGQGKGKGQGKPKGGGSQGQGQGQGRSQGQGKPKGGRSGKGGQPPNPAEELKQPLERVLSRLPETQRRVLELRMGLTDGHPHDLADTARTLGLSLSEAREIEKRAFEHIREAVPLQQLQRFLQG